MKARSIFLALLAALLPFAAFGETRPVDPDLIDLFFGVGGRHGEDVECQTSTAEGTHELCRDTSGGNANTLWWCPESASPCLGSGWVQVGGGGSFGPDNAEYIVAEANGTLSAEVAPTGTDQVPVSDSSTAATWRELASCTEAQTFHFEGITNTFDCNVDDGQNIAVEDGDNSGTFTTADETVVRFDDGSNIGFVLDTGTNPNVLTALIRANNVTDTSLQITKNFHATWNHATINDDIYVKVFADSTITLTELDCTATGSITPSAFVVSINECDANGTTCGSATATVTLSALVTNQQDNTFADATIDNNDWIRFDITSLTTAPDYAHCRLKYIY